MAWGLALHCIARMALSHMQDELMASGAGLKLADKCVHT